MSIKKKESCSSTNLEKHANKHIYMSTYINLISRKGSRLTYSINIELSGSGVDEQLFKLNSNSA